MRKVLCDDMDEAARRQVAFARFRKLFGLGTFPSVIKAALKLRGFKAGPPRLPVLPLSEEKRTSIREWMAEVLTR